MSTPQLTLLTYNTHLFEGSNAEFGADQDNTGASGAVMYATWNGRTWQTGSTGTNTIRSPGVTAFNGQFYLFYVNSDRTIGQLVSTDGVHWSAGSPVGFSTSGGVCAIVYQNTLNVFFRDPNGGGVLQIFSIDGSTWTRTVDLSDHYPLFATINATVS